MRVDWQAGTPRSSRASELGGADASEPGRAAARLIETLRASRLASPGDALPDAGVASPFATMTAATPPAATASIAPMSPSDAPATPIPLSNPWPLDDPAFAQHLAAQVQETLLEGIDRAEIAVTPPSMGPIRIELSLSGEQATVAFSAAMPETCRAIEQSLPMLETMLSKHGVVLADASVQAGNSGPSPEHGHASGQPRGEPGSERGGAPSREPRGDVASDIGSAGGQLVTRSAGAARGLIDLFA